MKSLKFELGRKVRPSPSESITNAFARTGWNLEYPVREQSRLRLDLYKKLVGIEVQLADRSDILNDLMKLTRAWKDNRIVVGVEIVYDDSIRGNVPKISKAINELEDFGEIISCPIWVIGLRND